MARILLPTDFSTNALNAARYAVQLFGSEGNTFVVVNAYAMPHGAESHLWSVDELLAQEAQAAMDIHVERLRTELADLRPTLEGICEYGELPQVIARYARDPEPPDAVVMGTQGASGLKEVLLGSNTADVIKRSVLPVLAVPEESSYRIPKRIILADDGGPVTKDTVRPLLDIARWSKAEVMIVRVVNEETSVDEGAGSIYDTLLGAIPHSFHYISEENVTKALHDMADQNDADLVVLVHRHRSLFEQLFHRSAATRLAMHTHIPMLVLQQPAD
jgi:nucleotide-binding universal stress UspA family protein